MCLSRLRRVRRRGADQFTGALSACQESTDGRRLGEGVSPGQCSGMTPGKECLVTRPVVLLGRHPVRWGGRRDVA